MLADPTATDEAKRELARTYNPPGYNDPWDAIKDYNRVIAYHADHPNKGSQAVSSAVNLPRSRIRPWLEDGSQPDCYRGLQTAVINDWFIEDWSHERAKAINCLAAWLLSSGSIDDRWVPKFVTDDDRGEINALQQYARSLDVGLELTRPDDESRPMEWEPTADATILGRVLHTWTGVRGDKASELVRFPEYLQFAPHHIVKHFVRIYIRQRGVHRTDTGEFIQIAVDRTDAFREALAACLGRVVSDTGSIRDTSWPIRIYEPAMSELQGYPELY